MTAIDGVLRLWSRCRVHRAAGSGGPFVVVSRALPQAHAAYIAPLWKQAVGSTIHSVAGDATGIIVGALIGVACVTPPRVDAIVEYVAGFAFGLFIFQALFMTITMGRGLYSGDPSHPVSGMAVHDCTHGRDVSRDGDSHAA